MDNEPREKRSARPTRLSDEPNSTEKAQQVDIVLERSWMPPALGALPITTASQEGALVIDVAGIFADDRPDFSAELALVHRVNQEWPNTRCVMFCRRSWKQQRFVQSGADVTMLRGGSERELEAPVLEPMA